MIPALLAVAILISASSAPAGEIGSGEWSSLPQAEIVLLGEVHDNPAHHRNQAEAVAALAPAAVVFEMLTPAQAVQVTPELRQDRRALEAALGWAESGWPDFVMYHPIFTAAAEARIYGAGVPREEASRAFDAGAPAVFGADAARFGLDLPLGPAEQETQEAEQQAAHCDALPAELLPGFVEAQRLRDAMLAREALRALQETGGPVAVITGNGHARRDRGVPAYLAAARPEATVMSVGQFEAAPAEAPPFDFWLVTEPAERPDPCEAFRG